MIKLLFFLILAILTGLLVDQYLHSSEAWHGDVGVELFQRSEKTESREIDLPIFLDGVPWDRWQKTFWDGVPRERWHDIFPDGVPWNHLREMFWEGFSEGVQEVQVEPQ